MLNFPENNSHNDINIQDPSGPLKNLQCAVVKHEACSYALLASILFKGGTVPEQSLIRLLNTDGGL